MHRHWPEDLYNASGLTAAIKGKESSRSDIGKPRAAMNLSDFKQRSQEDYRQLRVVTILAFLLAVCLLLPHGMVAERPFPAIGIAPMFFSAAMGVLIFTGIHTELPVGFEIQIRPRSGFANKQGASVVNAPGTIDANFRNEIGVIFMNTDLTNEITINRGDRIAQGVVCRVERVNFEIVSSPEFLSPSERGLDGFGSTGVA